MIRFMERKDVLLLAAPPFPARNEGIGLIAKEAGWNIVPGNLLFDGMRGWRGDGALVTLRQDPAVLSFVRRLMRRGIPVVDMTSEHPEIGIPRVCVDNRAIGRLAAEHFAERGYRHAAWFSTNWSPLQAERYAGFAEGLAKEAAVSGLPEKWVLAEGPSAKRRNDSAAVARWFAGLLRAAPKPLAVLCNETKDAARVLAECRFLGIAVPDEIAILGVGDDPMLCENQAVPLSSIMQNGRRSGMEAAALLGKLMDGGTPPEGPVLVPPAGIAVRASTECVAAGDPLVARALALVARNLSRPWGVGQLAAELGVSPAGLSRRFRADLGCAPGAEIARQRLVRAKALLRDTTLGLAEISALCGICNAPYLSNLVRRETGLSPRRYRASQAAGASGRNHGAETGTGGRT